MNIRGTNGFREKRDADNPPEPDVKRGGHFLQADL